MKIVGVIPARYSSTRLPGKPLADICGKPMIQWVYESASRVKELNELYVATDNKQIYDVCKSKDMNVLITSDIHKTGTDRVAEVAARIPADLYVNIQGDEPLIEPQYIRKVILSFKENQNLQIINLMTVIKDPVEIINFTIPKVITNRESFGVYLTRSAVPYPKGKTQYYFYKQIGVYAFTPEALSFYGDYGKKYGKAKLEEIEDIEILRYIENGIPVYYVEVEADIFSVDTPNDLEVMRDYMQRQLNKIE